MFKIEKIRRLKAKMVKVLWSGLFCPILFSPDFPKANKINVNHKRRTYLCTFVLANLNVNVDILSQSRTKKYLFSVAFPVNFVPFEQPPWSDLVCALRALPVSSCFIISRFWIIGTHWESNIRKRYTTRLHLDRLYENCLQANSSLVVFCYQFIFRGKFGVYFLLDSQFWQIRRLIILLPIILNKNCILCKYTIL